jgi:CubicO group peptidase (beta-lactamase class C family)
LLSTEAVSFILTNANGNLRKDFRKLVTLIKSDFEFELNSLYPELTERIVPCPMKNLSLPSLLSLATTLSLSLITASTAADYFPPPDTQGGWRTLNDAKSIREIAGMDLARLDQAYQAVERSPVPNGGLLVVRHGYLVYEKYFGKARRNVNPDMASTGKAYTSIACGIMLNELKEQFPEGLNQKVYTEKYLPEAFPLDDPRKADITLGQLLCMTSGHHGEGSAPGIKDGAIVPLTPVPGQDVRHIDASSLKVPLWIEPGAGYSYSSPAPHIASMVLRRATGMELPDYIEKHLAKPMGWGPWAFCLHRGDVLMEHANGAGSIAVHATDALRFGYCLLKNGRWNDKQLVPADYIALCRQALPMNPHTPYSLMFEHNADGHILAAPKDAFFKNGSGGFCVFIVPSLDLVIYKMGGTDGQYNPELTGLPQEPDTFGARTTQPLLPKSGFFEGASDRRVLEYVCAAVRD